MPWVKVRDTIRFDLPTRPMYEGMPPWELHEMSRADWEIKMLLLSVKEHDEETYWAGVPGVPGV